MHNSTKCIRSNFSSQFRAQDFFFFDHKEYLHPDFEIKEYFSFRKNIKRVFVNSLIKQLWSLNWHQILWCMERLICGIYLIHGKSKRSIPSPSCPSFLSIHSSMTEERCCKFCTWCSFSKILDSTKGSNSGISWKSLSQHDFTHSIEENNVCEFYYFNFWTHQTCYKASVKIYKTQKMWFPWASLQLIYCSIHY
jgi:hypothetical protein